jgi:hypothetical protein
MTEKRQTSQGYIIRILQHFATKLRNITNFVMLFQAVMKFLSRLVYIKISLKRGKVYCDVTFLTVFILTHPVNFPCGRKPEHPEKTHDFRQSVDRLFSHESIARIEPTNSEVKDACSDDCPTEAPGSLCFPLTCSDL